MMTLSHGERLRKARERRKLSQEQLAAMLSLVNKDKKIYQSFVHKVETNYTRKIDFDLLKEWCRILDVDANEFLGLKAR